MPLFSAIDMYDKKELRKYFSSVRKSAKSQEKDTLIAARLLSERKITEADTVLLFASFGSEPDTWKISEVLLSQGKTVAFPKCQSEGNMTFHCIKSLDELKSGAYGICEPDTSLSQLTVTDKTVCIVPGLAFAESGARLGYGGGFYDRFLASHPYIIKTALAYEAVITDKLPIGEHDIAVNYIVTEERTVLCNA